MESTILKELPTSLEVLETLKNLEKLSPLNLSSKEFKSTLQTYAEEQLVIYKSEQQQQAGGLEESNVIYSCFVNEQRKDDYYINQLTNELIRVESLDGVIIERKPLNEENKLSETNQKLLAVLYEKLSAYVDMHYYKKSSAITCHFTINQEKTKIEQITIGITSKLNNVDNFYSGETVSIWKFSQSKYAAVIKAANHFYENGNIMFDRERPIEKVYEENDSIKLDDFSEQEIDKILKVIKKEEKAYQKELETLFNKKCSEALKKIRRVTPLTQNKMIWNLNAVRMNEEINVELPKMAM